MSPVAAEDGMERLRTRVMVDVSDCLAVSSRGILTLLREKP